MTLSKKRIDYIDISKGIGIILLIIGHNTYGLLHNFIYLFHMPLFLFLSGMNIKKGDNIFDYKLITTYIVDSLLFIAFGFCHYGDVYSTASFCETVAYTISTHGISVLWFLSALIYTKFIVNLVLKIKKSRYQMLIIFIMYTCAFFAGHYLNNIAFSFNVLYLLVYSITRSLVLVPFVFLGLKTKDIINDFLIYCNKKNLLSSIMLLVLFFVLLFASCNIYTDYHVLYSGIYLISIILGLSGVLLVLIIAIRIERTLYIKTLLIWCGKHSLPIMLTEYFKIKKHLYSLMHPISIGLDAFIERVFLLKIHIPIHIPLYILSIYFFSEYFYRYIEIIIKKISKNKFA